ncbi:hypothetical protein NQ318_015582, partial [Aromia moschata]
YCKNAPSTQLSTGNIMFVKFFTDTDEPKNGFKAEVDLAYCGGTVRGSEGEIRSPSHLDNKLGQFCGLTPPPPFSTSTNKATVQFRGDSTDKFILKFNASMTVCVGDFNGQQGLITQPSVRNSSYWCLWTHSNMSTIECVWLLKVDKEQVINLTSVNEDLGSDCEKNYLSVYNGDLPSHPRIGKFCKDNKFYAFISQRNSLWIEYKWETGSSGTGVKLKYEAIEQGCGGIFHDKSRIIQSANYGKDYPNNAECLWEIRSDPGYSIRLEFIDRFHIETSQDCKNDYLEAKWDWRCGGTFEASSTPRYIVSPGYPLHYSSNLVCIYNITSKKDVVNIRFEDFELERGSSNCAFDNVTVKVQYGSYSLSNQVFCGTNKPPLVRVRGKTLITFKTDDFIHKKGFKFMFKDEQCGGEITEEQSIEFQAVKTDMGTYRVLSALAEIVSLLDMPEAPNCFIQNLQVYNGPDEIRNRRLVALCGYIKRRSTYSRRFGQDVGEVKR